MTDTDEMPIGNSELAGSSAAHMQNRDRQLPVVANTGNVEWSRHLTLTSTVAIFFFAR
jgi:hypothetical protein